MSNFKTAEFFFKHVRMYDWSPLTFTGELAHAFSQKVPHTKIVVSLVEVEEGQPYI